MTTPIERLVAAAKRVVDWTGRNDPLHYEEVCNRLRNALALYDGQTHSAPERSCATCACWHGPVGRSEVGQCRRSPPTVTSAGETDWPRTGEADWCHDGYVAKS